MGAETHLGLVHREVGDAAAKREQLLVRIAVLLVLPDRVVHRLLGEVVLELEGDDRQAVDEERDVERPLRFVPAVAKLSGDGEAVPLEAVPRLLVARRRRTVEEVEVVRAMPDTVAQHLDRAPLGNLALQPRQELAPCRAVLPSAPGPRPPPAGCHAGSRQAGRDRRTTRGRSRGSCRRASPPRRSRPAARPRCSPMAARRDGRRGRCR